MSGEGGRPQRGLPSKGCVTDRVTTLKPREARDRCREPVTAYFISHFICTDYTDSIRVWDNVHFSGFKYQHVGIGKAKLWRWGSKPM